MELIWWASIRIAVNRVRVLTENCLLYTTLPFTSGEEEEGYWEKVLDSKGSKKGRKKPGRGGKRRGLG